MIRDVLEIELSFGSTKRLLFWDKGCRMFDRGPSFVHVHQINSLEEKTLKQQCC